jgi:hypothetical protein
MPLTMSIDAVNRCWGKHQTPHLATLQLVGTVVTALTDSLNSQDLAPIELTTSVSYMDRGIHIFTTDCLTTCRQITSSATPRPFSVSVAMTTTLQGPPGSVLPGCWVWMEPKGS